MSVKLLPNQDIALQSATDTVDEFISLRQQLDALQHRIEAMQPAFYAACASFGIDKIQAEHAIINRRLTPGKWGYSPSILSQEEALKKLKLQFQKAHEPIAGREVIWSVRFLSDSDNATGAQEPRSGG
jgi:hypothetical protein